MRFLDISMLLLLWLIPLLVASYIYAGYKRRQAMALFVESKLLPLINTSSSTTRRHWKLIILICAFVLGTIAAARPAWNPIPKMLQREGRDVVFILDISKSMLAEDLAPNRLTRAKLAIIDVIDKLEGDRIAIVIFAGNALVKCPLTLDYGFFRMMLETLSTDDISRGGTMIGDAIRKALDDVFDNLERKYKDIILITDGEDHDSFPIEAAAAAGKRGIRLLTIGIGDEDQGKRIPITDADGRRSFLQYKGKEVWSKLDADTLRKMVNATPGGRYLNVATGTIDLGDVYTKLIKTAEKRTLESKTVQRYEEKYQIFLGLMFLLLCIELLISERKKL